MLGIRVRQVEVAWDVRAVGAALILASEDPEAVAARLLEALVHEAPLGLLGHHPINGVRYRGARRAVAFLGPEE